jgi:hypothetical protein
MLAYMATKVNGPTSKQHNTMLMKKYKVNTLQSMLQKYNLSDSYQQGVGGGGIENDEMDMPL